MKNYDKVDSIPTGFNIDCLYSPTYITKIGSRYFIIDCWHHRIIYSESLEKPIKYWNKLDENIPSPHSLAGNSKLYIADSAGSDSIRLFNNNLKNITPIYEVKNIGKRPHRILYENDIKLFFIICSLENKICIIDVKNQDKLKFSFVLIPELESSYTRSITIYNKQIYFTCSNFIIIYNIKDNEFSFVRKIQLHNNYNSKHGINDLFFFDNFNGKGILTLYPNKMILFDNINELINSSAEDISFLLKGTPYYINQFDNRIWIPEIDNYSRICSYGITNDTINVDDQIVYFDSVKLKNESFLRKRSMPF